MAIPVLPDSAPFSTVQRAWLNGFFAGVLSLEPRPVSSGSDARPAVMAPLGNGTVATPAAVPETEEDFPWHDPALTISERLALAEGQPLDRRLMAAMAQLDCGTCGYLCITYAQAIAGGEERDLARCTPGGRETTKKLKEMMAAATN
jgi:sulfite reductase (NADPH) flavoprotein alpha-component